ncbi:hypothetical protein BJV82DRAFT_587405 [Fennellomyces sp. T-0311]|nr:hypothetical protein BJV82DRAFT_587405 [Fennellomyces sp. T-0311]
MSDNPDKTESSSPGKVAGMASNSAMVTSTTKFSEEPEDRPTVTAPTRKRGRPRKLNGKPEEVPKRKPGRPPKLPAESTRPDQGPPVKRPRGRPPKPKVQGPKRRPGRPRKIPCDNDQQPVAKRPRGRPRKNVQEKRKPGRPRKYPVEPSQRQEEHSEEPAENHPQESPMELPKVKRGPGRPRKYPPTQPASNGAKQLTGSKRERPKQDDAEPPRKRGRPRKVAKVESTMGEPKGERDPPSTSDELPQIVLTNADGSDRVIRKESSPSVA